MSTTLYDWAETGDDWIGADEWRRAHEPPLGVYLDATQQKAFDDIRASRYNLGLVSAICLLPTSLVGIDIVHGGAMTIKDAAVFGTGNLLIGGMQFYQLRLRRRGRAIINSALSDQA